MVLADPEDFTALAQMIRRLAADPALCARVGADAARNVAQYTWDRNAAELKEILEAFLAGRERGRGSEPAGRAGKS
jgi:glycosyltransferase involved in cell wall biosynthesis